MMSDLFLGGYSSVVITDEKENSCTELNTTRTPTKNYHDLKLSMDDKSESGSQFNTDGTHTNSLKKRALSSRNSNVHYRSTAEDSRQDPEQKKQRSSFTSNQHTCINEASASKYDQDKYQDSETLYPDTLKSYFEELSDGFRTDFKELFQNGIRAFDTSLKFLLPNPFSSNSGDSLQDLEIRSVRTTPSMVPISDDTSRPSVLPKKISKEEKAAKQLQVDAALRMRCPSMWDKKETNIKLSTTQNPETPTECQSIAVANNSTGSNVSNTLRNKGKECRKISLTKLYNNQSITYFPCDDNKILILGNKRLMLVSKDSIDVALGNVDWCESVLDVDKCNMSFQSRSKGGIQLELGTVSGNSYLVPFSDAASSGRILQIIHERMNQQNPEGLVLPTSTPLESLGNNFSMQLQSRSYETMISSSTNVDPSVMTNNNDRDNYYTNAVSTNINYTPVHNLRSAYGGNPNSICNTIKSKNSDGNLSLLSPMSSSLAKTVARQLKHGVGEIGLRGKLEIDGVSIEKADRILKSAKTIMSDSTPTTTTTQLGTALTIDDASRHHLTRRKSEQRFIPDASEFRPSKLSRIEESAVGYDIDKCSQNSPISLSSMETHTFPFKLSLPLSSPAQDVESCRIINESKRINDCKLLASSCFISVEVSAAELPMHLKKYELMLKTGVTLPAVMAKMNMDKINVQEQLTVTNLQQIDANEAIVTNAAAPSNNEVTTALKKYETMLWTGVPMPAVIAKMKLDNISQKDQQLIIQYQQAEMLEILSKEASCDNIDENIKVFPFHLKKYQMMLKTGVPLPAVIAKMTIENVSVIDQAMITESRSIGLKCDDTEGKSMMKPVLHTELPAHLKKFQMMIKTGVPLPAVVAKMNQEKITSSDQALVTGEDLFCTNLSASSNPTPLKVVSELPAHLKKFQMMIKTGVPLPAVVAKMNQEMITSSDQALVTGGSASSLVSATPTNIVDATNQGEIPAALKKYQLMLKSGVPMPAVIAKMTLDKVSAEDQSIVAGSSQLKTPANFATQNLKPVSEQKSNGPKLLGLHWDPIDKDTLDKSIWGNLAANDLSLALADEELNQLVTMFARKDGNAKAKEAVITLSSLSSSNVKEDPTKASKSIAPKFIDSSRVMNISIGINSFKSRSLDINKICYALELLDTEVLAIDDVLRIKELLPSEVEAKSLSNLSEAVAEGLHDAEKVLYKLCKVHDFRGKIAIMIFLLNFEASRKHIESCTDRLKAGAENAVASEGLAEIMKSVLAIGNAMNDGTWKGGAVGFKLSSLSRLNQTKSADGSSTVMDYLVKILHGRLNNALNGPNPASLALSVDTSLEELSMCKAISMTELEKDLKSLQNDFKRFQVISKAIRSRKNCEDSIVIDNRTIYRLQEQESNIQNILVILEGSIASSKSAFATMVAYFGETSASATTEFLFGLLDNFLSDLSRAKQKFNSKKNRKA